MEAIKIINISKKYQLKSENVIAVNGVSYSFLYGKLYAIMGHSGSGKSTLIHCLGLLDKVDSGKIYINDKDIVIANIDGTYTIKIYRIKNDKIWLEAANPDYKNIYPKFKLDIFGKVTGITRKIK